jgi:hypothetical protein
VTSRALDAPLSKEEEEEEKPEERTENIEDFTDPDSQFSVARLSV